MNRLSDLDPHFIPVDSPDRRRLPPALRRAWYGLNQAFRRRIAHIGLTPDQFTVLRTLHEHDAEELSQAELAEVMSSDPNTIAALVERMESAKCLKREPHKTDRRALRLNLLPEGRKRFTRARDIAIQLQEEVLSVLPQSEKDHFLENLAKVAAACWLSAENSPRKRVSNRAEPPPGPDRVS